MYDTLTKQASGPANAMLGSYLGKLGFSYKSILWMTIAPANQVNHLNYSNAGDLGIRISGYEDLPAPQPQIAQQRPIVSHQQESTATAVNSPEKCEAQGFEWRDQGPDSYCTFHYKRK
jgi:hypothetical protein